MRNAMKARLSSPYLVLFATAITALAVTANILAQAPLPPVLVNPLAPTLAAPTPLGMQRGTTLELTLTGTNLVGPTQFWTSFPAKITIPTDKNNGKLANQL